MSQVHNVTHVQVHSPLSGLVFLVRARKRTVFSGSRCGRNRGQRWERRTLCVGNAGGDLEETSSPTMRKELLAMSVWTGTIWLAFSECASFVLRKRVSDVAQS